MTEQPPFVSLHFFVSKAKDKAKDKARSGRSDHFPDAGWLANCR
jgi:hypothetical protein